MYPRFFGPSVYHGSYCAASLGVATEEDNKKVSSVICKGSCGSSPSPAKRLRTPSAHISVPTSPVVSEVSYRKYEDIVQDESESSFYHKPKYLKNPSLNAAVYLWNSYSPSKPSLERAFYTLVLDSLCCCAHDSWCLKSQQAAIRKTLFPGHPLLTQVTVRYHSLIVLGTPVKSMGNFALFLNRRGLSHTKRPNHKFTTMIAQAALLFPGWESWQWLNLSCHPWKPSLPSRNDTHWQHIAVNL